MPNAFVVRRLLCSRPPSSQAMQGQAARKADDNDGACSNGISRHEVERANTMHPAKSSIATGIFHHHRNMGSYVIQSYARQRNLLPPVKPLGTRSPSIHREHFDESHSSAAAGAQFLQFKAEI